MSKRKELKEYLKGQAQVIRATRYELKENQREGSPCWKTQGLLDRIKHDYRHKHIAYCLLRGTPYESIEKPAKGNEPDMDLIKEIQNAYSEPTPDVCVSATGSL